MTSGRERRRGGPIDVERRERTTELVVRHRPDALAHAGPSSTVRSRPIARDNRDFAVPSRTSSTSAVSASDNPRRKRYPMTSRSGGDSRLSAAIKVS